MISLNTLDLYFLNRMLSPPPDFGPSKSRLWIWGPKEDHFRLENGKGRGVFHKQTFFYQQNSTETFCILHATHGETAKQVSFFALVVFFFVAFLGG